jgi:excisionase family DNA binding protein
VLRFWRLMYCCVVDSGRELLTTGEVATLLAVSRQHVVDLCERGEMLCIRVGTHRRVPRREVDRLLGIGGPSLTREQEKSLWLHRALVGYVLADPDAAIARAREQVTSWRAVHRRSGMTDRSLESWSKVLDSGLEAVIEVLTSRRSEAVELRVNSPFAGLLPDEVRRDLLVSFGRWWRLQDHAA